jgi:hypothetical protein
LQEKAKWLFEQMAFAYWPIGLMMAEKMPGTATKIRAKRLLNCVF